MTRNAGNTPRHFHISCNVALDTAAVIAYLIVRRPYQPAQAVSGEGSTTCNKPHDGPAFLSERLPTISDQPPYASTGKAAISKRPDRIGYSPKNKHLSFGRNRPCKRLPGFQSRTWPP